MAINARNSTVQRELIPAGNYIARCYEMLEIGTVKETILGVEKILKKVRIGWELPTEKRVFQKELGEQPLAISKEFTLSMHEKSTLRKTLASWRGKDFTELEAECFDITKLLGVVCMINIIHTPGAKDPSKMYETISGVTPIPKGLECPAAINPVKVLEYESFNREVFETLPDFIKDKIKSSAEYKQMMQPHVSEIKEPTTNIGEPVDDLPF